MKIAFPKLPYATKDLEPSLSARAVELHYSTHLRGYIDKLNQLPQVANAPEKKKIEELILEGKRERESMGQVPDLPPGGMSESSLFNLSAQVYNHVFFFHSLHPKSGGPPAGDFGKIVDAQYGSWEKFRMKLIAKGMSLFGSGWVWVCLDDEGDLLILRAKNAEVPIIYKGLSPLFCIDVWEHAYYPDYQADRAAYLKAVIDNLLNWNFVRRNLSNA